MKRFKKGFTLIELLVVIAIIGILAAIVLASLSTARTKAVAAKVEGQLAEMRSAAEIYYSANPTLGYGTAGSSNGTAGSNCGTTVSSANSTLYSDTASNMAGLVTGTTGATGMTAAMVDCGDSSAAWSVAAQLPGGGYDCVDSTGASRTTTSAGTVYTGLVGASPAAHTTAGATVCN